VCACVSAAGCTGIVQVGPDGPTLDGSSAEPSGADAGDAGLPTVDSGSLGSDAGSDGGGPARDAGLAVIDGGTPDGGVPDAGDAPDADTTPCALETQGGVMLSTGTPLAAAVVPNPIVSLNKPVTTTTPGYNASQLFLDPPLPNNVNTTYGVAWQPAPGQSVTINVGTGPTDLLMVWQVDYPDYVAPSAGFGLPYGYQIDISPDGTTWTSVVPATTTNYRSREAKFAFSGNSYVRFTVLSTTAGDNSMFRSMKIFDASHGTEDTWLVAGPGPSRFVYNDVEGPGFGHLVNSCRPKYYPALINISDLTPSISNLVAALQAPAATNWLSLNPDFHFWILTYGLEDLGSVSTFSSTLESAVQLLLAAGKVPVLTHIQYVTPGNGGGIDPTTIVPFNAAIDALVAKYKLLPSPDLYAWFEAHPTQLCTSADDSNDPSGFCGETQWNGIQPINVTGRTGVSDTIRLWAAATTAGGVYAQ